MKTYVLYFIFLISIGCQIIQKSEHSPYNETHEFILTDTLALPLSELSAPYYNNMQYLSSGTNEYLLGLNWINRNIEVYNINEESVDHIIELESNGPNGVGPIVQENSSFHALSLDSIFLLNQSQSRIYLINAKVEVIGYDIINNDFGIAFSSLMNPSIAIGNSVLFPVRHDFEEGNVSDKHSLLIKNGLNDEIVFEKYLSESLNGFPYGLHNFFYEAQLCHFDNEHVLLSYPGLTTVEVHNLNSGSIRLVDVKDPEIGLPRTYDKEVKRSEGYKKEYNEFYLYADLYNQILKLSDDYFVRLVRYGDDPEIKGRYYHYSFLLLNHELKPIGRFNPAKGTYMHQYPYCFTDGKGGIYLFNSRKYYSNENFLFFDKFRVGELAD